MTLPAFLFVRFVLCVATSFFLNVDSPVATPYKQRGVKVQGSGIGFFLRGFCAGLRGNFPLRNMGCSCSKSSVGHPSLFQFPESGREFY